MGAAHVPPLKQRERVLLPPLFYQQHGQRAVAVRMIWVPVQAQVVVGFGLFQLLSVLGLASFLVMHPGQVVVEVRVIRIQAQRLVEQGQGAVVVALVVEPHPLGIDALGVPGTAGTGSQIAGQGHKPEQPAAACRRFAAHG